MKARSTDWLLALAGGSLLAIMIHCNSLLAKHSRPVLASWVAHGTGAVVALALVAASSSMIRSTKERASVKAPWWAYGGGLPGALTVWLAAIAVNSSLGLSGALALMLVGQVLFGIASDRFGLFGIPKRPFIPADALVVLLVLTGSGILIYFRS